MVSLSEKIRYQSKLPEVIKVKIEKSPNGGYLIKIVSLEYCFTQADTKEEILIMVNDVVYSHFDIPEKIRPLMPLYFPTKELKEKLLQEWEKAIPAEFLNQTISFTQNGIPCGV